MVKKVVHRVCAVGIIRDSDGRVLILKMPENKGVYPGQWGLVGGGIDSGELMEEGLKREVREEVGIEVDEIRPFWFFDDRREKVDKDGSLIDVYMIYLMFDCLARSKNIKMNEEWIEYKWVEVEDLEKYDLNSASIKTFEKKGWI